MELSKRLEAIISLVDKDCKAADVGTDHGYVPIALIKRGIVNKIIAMDVKPGPLRRAQEHVKQMELSEWIDLRLSDGLDQLAPGEADTVLMSGMGGYLIIQLLQRGQQVLKKVQTLILSPQSAAGAVRKYIMKIGFTIVKEVMVEDDGKFYTVIKASRVKDGEKLDGLGEFESASNDLKLNCSGAPGGGPGSEEKAPESTGFKLSDSAETGFAENEPELTGFELNGSDVTELTEDKPEADEFELNSSGGTGSAANGLTTDMAAKEDSDSELFLQYGKYLLETKDPVTQKYLQKRKDNFILIKEKYLDNSQSLSGQRRLLELERELSLIDQALRYFEDKKEGR